MSEGSNEFIRQQLIQRGRLPGDAPSQDVDNREASGNRSIYTPERRKPSTLVRLSKFGTIALATSLVGGMAYGVQTDYAKSGDLKTSFDGVMYPFDQMARLIDYIKGEAPKQNSPVAISESTPSTQPSSESVPSPSPSPSPSESKQSTPESCIEDMPVRYKLAQNMIVPVNADGSYHTKSGTSIPETFDRLRAVDVGGVIVMGDPSKDPAKTVAKFTDGKTFNDPLIVGIDQEGGKIVKRVDNDMPSQQDAAKMSPAEARAAALKSYRQLKDIGATMVFGPVLDVSRLDGEPSKIGESRIFSKDPAKVALYSKEYQAAAAEAGIEAVGKHFPGGGAMTENTDLSEGTSTIPSKEELLKHDLKAWELAKGAIKHAMITTSIVSPSAIGKDDSWTNGEPAVFSNNIYDALRSEYKVKGIITTDDLGQEALRDKDGKIIPLAESFPKVWKNGGTPLYVVDSNNTASPLPLDKRLKSLIDSGEKALEAGDISKTTLNTLMKTRLETQGRLDQACSIAAREAAELKIYQ